MTTTPKAKREKHYLVNFSQLANLTNELPQYFIFFDTETRQAADKALIGQKKYDIVKNTLKLGWACFWNRRSEREEWFYIDNIRSFHKWLGAIFSETKNAGVWIIAHNIVFDAIITDIWALLEKRNYTSEFVYSKGMSYIQKLKNKSEKNIILLNSGNIFPGSLEEMGKAIDKPKMEIDFESCTMSELSDYCRNDTDVLLTFFKYWLDFIDFNELGKMRYTISAQALEAFKKRFCKDYIVLDDNMDNLRFERSAYYGGRTEIFYTGKVKEPVYCYDVNSMYPHVMRENYFPTEYIFDKFNPEIPLVRYYISRGWQMIAECYLETEEPAYPYREGELLFPVGKFKTTLATPEIIYALESDVLKGFGKVSFYHSAQVFKDYIDFFYGERVKYKAQKNSREGIMKLFLNGLSGKFGQKSAKWEQITVDQVKQLYPDFNLDQWLLGEYKLQRFIVNGVMINPKLRYIGNELQVSTDQDESDFSFPAISAHITSYARVLLWKYIKYCRKSDIKVYYCDTDSLFTSKELPEELISKDKLGKLKQEKIYPYGIEFKGLKNYAELDRTGNIILKDNNNKYIYLDDEKLINESKIIKGDSWKLKGISKNAVMVDRNTFIQEEWSGISKQQYYLRFGRKAGEYWILYIKKEIQGEIKKGKILSDGSIVPFELQGF